MKPIQSISINPFIKGNTILEINENTDYLWENLIIEKRKSSNQIRRFFKGIILEGLWLLLSSPVN